MAEVVLTSIVKSALQLFTSLAKDEFVLLWHSQKELERLQLTIETISDLLQDADKMQSKQLSVLNCLSRLRNVMYDAEDFLDAMVAQVLRKKTMSGNSFTKEELYLRWNTLLDMKVEDLEFICVDNVIDMDDVVMEQQIPLRRLTIQVSGEWIHDIPWKSLGSLERLSLYHLEEMEQIPDGIQHLNSLQFLYIEGCKKLRSLPNLVPSLRKLEIWNCSEELKRRCHKETGEDWPLICHIHSIHINLMLRQDFYHLLRIKEVETHNDEEPRNMGWCGLTRRR